MIEKKVLEAIKDYNMLNLSRKITVALSGGADSVCLLHVLNSLKDKLGIQLSAAHLNHLIRGEEALRDENFAKEFCEKLGVQLFCEQIDVPRYAAENTISTELAAREIRYGFLNRVSDGLIATAHNSGDNLETVLFNLTRGTALKGLTGIPPVRDNIIRPLIYCSRQEIEDYCNSNGLSFVTDSTNLSDDYTRNKIRHNIIPLLKELNCSVETAVLRMGKTLSEDNDFIDSAAQKEFSDRLNEDKSLSLKNFDCLHISVAIRVIKFFCEESGAMEFSGSHLKQLYNICLSSGEAQLPGCSFISSGGRLYKKENSAFKKSFSVEIEPVLAEEFLNAQKINNLLLKSYIDCDKIVGKLVIRTRQIGDCVKLKNKNGTKPLTKLYNEYHIENSIRQALPVVVDDKGVVFIYKIGVAERAAADENSKNILKIKVFEGEEKYE